jgi:hypothetical protein
MKAGSKLPTNQHGALPRGWVVLEEKGLWWFTTYRRMQGPDHTTVAWESRRHRKRRPGPSGSTWWAPAALGWWIGVLFAGGSTCFAVGALPPYTVAVGAQVDAVTYFVGSLLFTSAALLLYCEVAWTPPPDVAGPIARVRQCLRLQPRRIDWLASLIQLVGTVYFNVSTGHAAFVTVAHATAANHMVWRPDALGSVCFLVSSWLSWAEVCHGPWRWRPRQLSWWIAILNLVGSVAFGASAIASKVEPNGSLRNLALSNLGTFVGALCFLAGALLLLPERTEGEDPQATPELAARVAAAT